MKDLKEADELYSEGEHDLCYDMLKRAYKANSGSVEVLWRLARACHDISHSFDQKNPERKALIIEGHKYAIQAYELDDTSFDVLKWVTAMSGGLTDYLSTREKIKEGYRFKMYLDKALEIHPMDDSLLHMQGRFSYSIANLSWFERIAATVFLASPLPSATIDDALKDFLEVEKIIPGRWIENLVYVSRCYIAKGNKPQAAKYLKDALKVEAIDDADEEMLNEVKELLNCV